MTNRILVVSEHEHDLYEPRLAMLAGLDSAAEFTEIFECISLMSKPGLEWDPAIATLGVYAHIKLGSIKRDRHVIALGTKVWRRLSWDRNGYIANFLPRMTHPIGQDAMFGYYQLYLAPKLSANPGWWKREDNLRAAAEFWHNATRGVMPASDQTVSSVAHSAS